MKKFNIVTSKVMPLNRANVDTDSIIPKQYLKSIKRSGFGVNLFDEWRYLDKGEADTDHSKRPINKDFVLNKSQYQNANIILAKDNFGCGSSREHAVWALEDYGFRAVIAPSFADIFYNNCFKNGVLPIKLPTQAINELFALSDQAEQKQQAIEISIDLAKQQVSCGDKCFSFEVDDFRKKCLLEGLDNIDLTLQHGAEIKSFEQKYYAKFTWLTNNN